MRFKELLILVVTLFFACAEGHAQKIQKVDSIIKEEKTLESVPEFHGGDEAFFRYLEKNVVLPEGFDNVKYLKENGNEYVPISVGFKIDVDGSIIDVKVLEKVNEALDKKAIEIVEKMPKWKPGIIAGKPVKVEYSIPVRFNLK